MRILMSMLVIALLTSACGGSDSTPSPTSPPVALLFNPAIVAASFEAGTSTTINVTAATIAPADFSGAPAVYGQLLDDSGVILPTARVIPGAAMQYNLVMQTSPSLAVGKYSGKFTVRLCRDVGCSVQFPGSPMSLPYEFQVVAPKTLLGLSSATPLVVSANVGAPAPVPATVNIKAGSTWTIASDASWLKPGVASGSGDGTVTLSYDSSGLGIGTHIATLTLAGADGQRAMLLATLQMLPSAFVIDSFGTNFSAVNGAPIAPQTVRLALDTGLASTWNASSDAAWLSVDPATGSTPAQTTLQVNPSIGPLASGVYGANVTLTSAAATVRKFPVQLELIKPTLSLSTNSLTLGGSAGRDYSSKAVSMVVNTQINAWPWTLAGIPDWANVASSGTVNQDGTEVVFTPNPGRVQTGTQTAMLTATVKVNGDTLTAPLALTINHDQLKILPSLTAVPMVSTPGWSNLTRTLTVEDNFNAATAWTASSDQSWLTLGVNGRQLTLTANPATLPTDAISYATVTLHATASGAATPESVRVAIWKGSSSPTATTNIAVPYRLLIADPMRPLLYAHNGAGSIDVYNVYTAQKTATISGLGTTLGEMAASPNGDRLYVYDLSTRSVVVVNLNTLARENSWPLGYFIDESVHLLAIRPNGVEMIMMGNGDVISPDTGKVLGNTGILNGVFAASADGKNVYVRNTALRYFSVDYSAMGGGTLLSVQNAIAPDYAYTPTADMALKADGSGLYIGTTSVLTGCTTLNPLTLGGVAGYRFAPTAVRVDLLNRLYCGAANTVMMYRLNGTSVIGTSSYNFSPISGTDLLPRQMAVSADGMFIAGLTRNPFLAIVPVGP